MIRFPLLSSLVATLAAAAPTPAPVITREDLRKTLEHIQQLAQDSERRAITAEDKEINVQKKLDDANKSIGGLKVEVTHLADDRDQKAADAAYWEQKHKEAVDKLWWWRIYAGGAFFIGIALLAVMLLTKFTAWGAKTFGPVITKVATGI